MLVPKLNTKCVKQVARKVFFENFAKTAGQTT
jgi:hypothetical protein